MTCDLTARPRVILGYLIAINAGDGQQPSGELASTDPTKGAQDAGVQECGISPAISVRLRAATYNTFNVQRHLISAKTHRAFRASAMQTWREVAAAA